MGDEALNWQVEDACLNACPAIRQVQFDGWLLRFAEGSRIRRNNSINPTHAALPATHERIALCEQVYRARERTPVFRVPDIARHGLDEALDARGYAPQADETLTLLADLGGAAPARDSNVVLSDRPDAEWLAGLSALQGHGEEERAVYARIVSLVALPSVFASLRHDGKIVSAAFAALSGPLVIMESVVTHKHWRGKGLARTMLSAVLAWASARGASAACLQVQGDNSPALALYRKLGFVRELYRYHYRRPPA